MVLAGTKSPRDGRSMGARSRVAQRIQRRPGEGPAPPGGPGDLRARLRVCPFRSVPVRPSAGHPHWKELCAYAPLRTHARHPPGRGGRQEPGPRRPDHPRDRRVRRPDRQGRPVGPPPAGLPDRSPSRGLVPHHPVRGAVRGDRRARAHPAHHRRGPPPPRHPRRAAGQGIAPATARSSTTSTARTCRPVSTRRTRTIPGEFIDESESEAAPAAID